MFRKYNFNEKIFRSIKRKENIMKRKFISFVLSFILIASICIPTLASSTTSQLQNQKDEIKDQIQDAKDEQNKVKQELMK